MDCEYCQKFQNSKWRIGPEPDESGKKKKDLPCLRHCLIANTYIKGSREACDSFEPHNKFWCNNYDCWMTVDACVNKHNKMLDPECGGCRQIYTIRELKRAIGFLKRKAAAEAARPTLLKRNK